MSSKGPFVLSIDQGTTSSRALLFDARGNIVHLAQKELNLITPQSGWVEQDSEQIWEDVLELCRDVLSKIDLKDVVGIAITNQRETTVVWDKKTGKPVYNAIVWQDRRTAPFCEALKDKESEIQTKTGLLVDPYFSGTKIKWILDFLDKSSDDLLFGTIDCFLLWKLTGGKIHATDATNASRTMMFDIHEQEWDGNLCSLLNVPQHMLPDVRDNMDHFGDTDGDLFGTSLPILAMAGDQHAATFGQCCFNKGDLKSTYGTGCFALMNTGDECVTSRHRLLSTVAWRVDGKVSYALEGSIFVAGAAVQFLRDSLKFFKTASESQALALSVDDTQGVVFVPAFTGLGAPYWNPDVRGAIMGLSRGTTPAHITRATLDAQAFQTRDLIDAMEKDSGTKIEKIRVDGGLVNNDYVCQTIANQTRCIIDRPVNTEATAWGVAAMAFMQAGIFHSFDDISNLYQIDQSFDHKKEAQDVYDQDYERWLKAVKATSVLV